MAAVRLLGLFVQPRLKGSRRKADIHKNRDLSGVRVIRSRGFGTGLREAAFLYGGTDMSKEMLKDDPRQQTDDGSLSQTDQPWKGNSGKRAAGGHKEIRSGSLAGNQHALREVAMGIASYEIVGAAGE